MKQIKLVKKNAQISEILGWVQSGNGQFARYKFWPERDFLYLAADKSIRKSSDRTKVWVQSSEPLIGWELWKR